MKTTISHLSVVALAVAGLVWLNPSVAAAGGSGCIDKANADQGTPLALQEPACGANQVATKPVGKTELAGTPKAANTAKAAPTRCSTRHRRWAPKRPVRSLATSSS